MAEEHVKALKRLQAIRKAIETGRISASAIDELVILIRQAIIEDPGLYPNLISEINQINKPLREQVDDAIKELDV